MAYESTNPSSSEVKNLLTARLAGIDGMLFLHIQIN